MTASDFYMQWYHLPLDRWQKLCDHKVLFSTKTKLMVNFEIFQVISPFAKNWLSCNTKTYIHNNDKIKNKIPFFSICQAVSMVPSVSMLFSMLLLDLQNTGNRSSAPELFLGKDVLKVCSKSTREQPCRKAILSRPHSNTKDF